MNVLVTGGAGLVGSSLCTRLLAQGARVFCVDNLTLGTRRHLVSLASNSDFQFETWDVAEHGWHKKLSTSKPFDLVVHLAANSDISLGHARPEMECRQTLTATFETLLAARELKIPNFVFSSSSAVYGAEPAFPTPELTIGMHPVSNYGAAKLASESFISSFVENYGLNAWVYRFGNVVGPKVTHGVIFDFNRRLKQNSKELTVLGNGQQSKTYIEVEDCVSGILHAFEKSPAGRSHAERFQVFNLSTDGTTTVREIAEESVRVVTQGRAQIQYGTSAIGWVGDVPRTRLAVDKMLKFGWRPKLNSTASVVQAIRGHYEWSQGHG